MHKLVPVGMERKQTVTYLLLACLLLAASAQCHGFITVMVQAIDSVPNKVDAELGTKQPESQPAVKYASAPAEEGQQQVEGMKKQKIPSGPNPIGNRHPPDRP